MNRWTIRSLLCSSLAGCQPTHQIATRADATPSTSDASGDADGGAADAGRTPEDAFIAADAAVTTGGWITGTVHLGTDESPSTQDRLSAMAPGPEGSVYVGGNFGAVWETAGNVPVPPGGFVARINARSDVEWVLNLSQPVGNTEVSAFASRPDGSLLVFFRSVGETAIGSTNGAGQTLFEGSVNSRLGLATFSPTGALIEAREVGRTREDGYALPIGLVHQTDGSALFAVNAATSYEFAAAELNGYAGDGGIDPSAIGKYDSSGRPEWLFPVATTDAGTADVRSIVPDFAGGAYIAGAFTGRVTIAGETWTAPMIDSFTFGEAYVAHIEGSGHISWARRLGGARHARLASAAPDALYAIATVRGSATFGSTTITTSGDPSDEDLAVVRIQPDGSFAWAAPVSGAGPQDAWGACARADGTFVFTGFAAGGTRFGAETLAAGDALSFFVASYSPAGGLTWLRSTPSDAGGTHCIEANDGALFVGAWFQNTVEFGDGFSLTAAQSDSAILRFAR